MTTLVDVPLDWPAELRAALFAYENKYWTLEAFEKYENADTFRLARAANLEEVAKYAKIRESGCCGSVDEVWAIKDTLILYGFNYGH